MHTSKSSWGEIGMFAIFRSLLHTDFPKLMFQVSQNLG